jgi:hypothetical protein
MIRAVLEAFEALFSISFRPPAKCHCRVSRLFVSHPLQPRDKSDAGYFTPVTQLVIVVRSFNNNRRVRL